MFEENETSPKSTSTFKKDRDYVCTPNANDTGLFGGWVCCFSVVLCIWSKSTVADSLPKHFYLIVYLKMLHVGWKIVWRFANHKSIHPLLALRIDPTRLKGYMPAMFKNVRKQHHLQYVIKVPHFSTYLFQHALETFSCAI